MDRVYFCINILMYERVVIFIHLFFCSFLHLISCHRSKRKNLLYANLNWIFSLISFSSQSISFNSMVDDGENKCPRETNHKFMSFMRQNEHVKTWTNSKYLDIYYNVKTANYLKLKPMLHWTEINRVFLYLQSTKLNNDVKKTVWAENPKPHSTGRVFMGMFTCIVAAISSALCPL